MGVRAARIIDLRSDVARRAVGIDLADATAPWQETVARGGTPSSWGVRDRIIDFGADGLVDPSRKRPGVWHLVLFRWNRPDAPTARLIEE